MNSITLRYVNNSYHGAEKKLKSSMQRAYRGELKSLKNLKRAYRGELGVLEFEKAPLEQDHRDKCSQMLASEARERQDKKKENETKN